MWCLSETKQFGYGTGTIDPKCLQKQLSCMIVLQIKLSEIIYGIMNEVILG